MDKDQEQRKTHGGFGEEEMESEGGVSMRPPVFQLQASGGGGVVQRQEADETAGAQPAPMQVPDSYRDPIANSNLSGQNIRLLIQGWETADSTQDDRKLAYILASAKHETANTMHSINEGLGDNYWPGYSNSGYWGRGFVQLTHDYNYEAMEGPTGVDLSEYPEAALLPQISAIVTPNGMVNGTFGGGGLNRHLPVTQNEDGTTTTGPTDYFNARRTVNGTDDAQSIADLATAIEASIRTFRAGVADGSITTDLATYLVNETTHFSAGREADAGRLLEATGHMNFSAPGFGSDATDQQTQYRTDAQETGYVWSLQRLTSAEERAALQAFQVEFNQNHNLDTPLPENGRLDEQTLHALTRAGQIQSGNNMIEFAFHGEVEAINPVTQAYTRHTAGELTIQQMAAYLVTIMPVPAANDVLAIFDNLGPAATEFAFALSLSAPTHNDLAYFNRAILDRMHALLGQSTSPRYQAMDVRITDLIAYHPPVAPFTTYTVVSGDSMGRIASRNNTTVDALVEFNNANGNPIADPGRISVGQPILIPGAQSDAPQDTTERPTVELSRYNIPEEPAPVTTTLEPTPDTTTETPTTETQSEAPATEKSSGEPLGERFMKWLGSIFGGSGGEGGE